MKGEKKSDGRVSVSLASAQKITLDEITIDISSFLQFLSKHSESQNAKLCSFWMLIPKALDVEWREEEKDFHLEKEIFSRTIYVISKPVPESEKEKRKIYLLNMFSNVISEDQSSQVIFFLKNLDEDSRRKIITEYQNHKATSERKK